ncbi:MAG: hypothetical protein JSS10_00515 [Verrucomicrobia bacterium]|nr:hypothetical protein [Verrucomicrobiota bacterium]
MNLRPVSSVSFSRFWPQTRSGQITVCVAIALPALAFVAWWLYRSKSPTSHLAEHGWRKIPYVVTRQDPKPLPARTPVNVIASNLPTTGSWGGDLKISQERIDKVKAALPFSHDNPEITRIKCQTLWVVYFPKITPDIVFMSASGGYEIDGHPCLDNDLIDHIYSNMQKGVEICKTNQLSLLVIPPFKKLEIEVDGKPYKLIAQRRVRYNPHEQKRLYHRDSQEMVETMRQLATFIALSGAERLQWDNTPFLDDQSYPGYRQVALLSWKFMNNASEGIFGREGYLIPGLIGMVFSEKQLNTVVSEAKSRGIATPAGNPREIEKTVQGRKEIRLREIEYYDRLCQFHEEKGICQDPRKEIPVESYGLDVNEEVKMVSGISTMREVIQFLIDEINEAINKAPEEQSIEQRRFVSLEKVFKALYGSKGFNSSKDQEIKELVLDRILRAMLEHEKIYSFGVIMRNGNFWVQV